MELDLSNLLQPLMLVGLRVSGLFLFAPVFGSAVLPMKLKAVLVIAVTAVLAPIVSTQMHPVQLQQWPLVVVHETIVGMAMGLSANLVFDAIQMAGQVLSVQMGYSLASLFDPQTQAESTVMAMFHQTIATLIFLGLNIHHALLRLLAGSFDYLPAETARLSPAFVISTLKLATSVFSLGVQIAAPVLAATMVADVVIGLLGKASPQMPLILLGPAVKSVLGAAVLLGVIRYWPEFLQRGFQHSIAYTEQLLHLAR